MPKTCFSQHVVHLTQRCKILDKNTVFIDHKLV